MAVTVSCCLFFSVTRPAWSVCGVRPPPFTSRDKPLTTLTTRKISEDERYDMHPAPNRLGLGMRQPMPSFGQGPSMGALAHQQQMLHHQQFSQPSKVVPVFIGSISGGISDAFLNELLSVSGFQLTIPRPSGFTTYLVLWADTTSQAADNAGRETPRIWLL